MTMFCEQKESEIKYGTDFSGICSVNSCGMSKFSFICVTSVSVSNFSEVKNFGSLTLVTSPTD